MHVYLVMAIDDAGLHTWEVRYVADADQIALGEAMLEQNPEFRDIVESGKRFVWTVANLSVAENHMYRELHELLGHDIRMDQGVE